MLYEVITVVVIAAIALLGNGVKNTFTNVTNSLK